MSKVSMDLVKELREKTQVSLMDCKKALEEANGDIETAIELLRKKGAAVAAKRAGHEIKNGRIEAYVSDDFKHGSLVEVGCETDFSANTQDMKDFAIAAAKQATADQTNDVQALLSKNKALENNLNDLLAKISERIQISKIANFNVAGFGIVNHYIHPGSTVGVLIEINAEQDAIQNLEMLKGLARDICMHIAVTAPLALQPSDLDPALIEKEKVIYLEQLKDTNKPANILEKIIAGRVNKFYEDVCLTSQRFIKNEDLTIQQLVKQAGDKIKNNLTIKRFARFAVGK